MGEGLGTWIKPVKDPIASDPQHAGAVFVQRINVGSGETVHPTRFVHKYLKFVSVVAVYAVLRPEPDEAAIVLDNLRDADLRKTLGCRDSGKSSASALDDGDVHNLCGNLRHGQAAAGRWGHLRACSIGTRNARREPSRHGRQGEESRADQSSVVEAHATRT